MSINTSRLRNGEKFFNSFLFNGCSLVNDVFDKNKLEDIMNNIVPYTKDDVIRLWLLEIFIIAFDYNDTQMSFNQLELLKCFIGLRKENTTLKTRLSRALDRLHQTKQRYHADRNCMYNQLQRKESEYNKYVRDNEQKMEKMMYSIKLVIGELLQKQNKGDQS